MKRIIPAVLSAVLLFALAACGAPEETTAGETAPTVPETADQATDATDPPPTEPAPPAEQTVSVGNVSLKVPGDYRHDEGGENRQMYVSPDAQVRITVLLFWQSVEDFAAENGCGSAEDVIRRIAEDHQARTDTVKTVELNGVPAAFGQYSSETLGTEYLYLIPRENARVHVVVRVSPNATEADKAAADAALKSIAVQ